MLDLKKTHQKRIASKHSYIKKKICLILWRTILKVVDLSLRHLWWSYYKTGYLRLSFLGTSYHDKTWLIHDGDILTISRGTCSNIDICKYLNPKSSKKAQNLLPFEIHKKRGNFPRSDVQLTFIRFYKPSLIGALLDPRPQEANQEQLHGEDGVEVEPAIAGR